MHEIWDSVMDEERFERKLKKLSKLSPAEKRRRWNQLNYNEFEFYRDHTEMNKIINTRRAMDENHPHD